MRSDVLRPLIGASVRRIPGMGHSNHGTRRLRGEFQSLIAGSGTKALTAPSTVPISGALGEFLLGWLGMLAAGVMVDRWPSPESTSRDGPWTRNSAVHWRIAW